MFKINNIDFSDIEEISELHHKAFKNFFLTSLGTSFIKYFYTIILRHKNSVSILLKYDNKIVGFAIGTLNNNHFYKDIIVKNIFSFSLEILKIILKNPLFILKLINKIKYSNSSSQHNLTDNLPCLLSICIDPELESKGMGKIILKEFEYKLIKKNATRYFLTTDSHENDYVNNFYLKNGFANIHIIKKYNNRYMNVYLKNIL
jgi:hypothetical protein